MKKCYYKDSLRSFLDKHDDTILGELTQNSEFPITRETIYAWQNEFHILRQVVAPYVDQGSIFLEYSIPRMGKRIDVVLVIASVVFVLEFKVGEKSFTRDGIDQVWDYALDLKNFHEPSHRCTVAPVLIATHAPGRSFCIEQLPHDKLLFPIRTNSDQLSSVIEYVLAFVEDEVIDAEKWINGRYCPTPTIVEAAMALYRGHSVSEISRSDASARNLRETSEAISQIILDSRNRHRKAICFVTGVPGAGKTLVGLDVATKHVDKESELYSVFLSGNGPLVAILREALARDSHSHRKAKGELGKNGRSITKKDVMSEVRMFIQNVHNFRDACLVDNAPPIEHVALFDEAQRAWNFNQTSKFMIRKKKYVAFSMSEPEFLISCLDRHTDWAVVVCLVGGGQEINTGEAGISEWVKAWQKSFSHWHVYISPRITDSEYGAGEIIEEVEKYDQVQFDDALHLNVSMRSFRAEHVSELVKHLLDRNMESARAIYSQIKEKYPIVISRDLLTAKRWLRKNARGSERYGIVVSSQAERLKPHAINIHAEVDPIHWFLDGKDDIRSSYYLEDVATEFDIQGLELDWVCVTWDGDFRYSEHGWGHYSFCGSRWNNVKSPERQKYLLNSYRVLLTRARQGMVIVVPSGDPEDDTRKTSFYDPTFEYLQHIGFDVI